MPLEAESGLSAAVAGSTAPTESERKIGVLEFDGA